MKYNILAITEVFPLVLDGIVVITDDPCSILEFAGRICYNSIGKTGSSPDFVRKRVEQGHADIIEHVRCIASFEDVDPFDVSFLVFISLPGVYWSYVDGRYVVSFNLRNLVDFEHRNGDSSAFGELFFYFHERFPCVWGKQCV